MILSKKPFLGIMQGRLSISKNSQIQSFPNTSWMTEFSAAAECGFDTIEWIFDELSNPIFNEKQKISSVSKENNVKINSLCADYFMIHKLFNEPNNEIEKNTKILSNLIDVCHESEIKIIEIPLVDSSSLKKKSHEQEILKNLESMKEKLEKYSMIINLETDLPPIQFKKLLDEINSPYIQANYDTGNSASLGYDCKEELDVLLPYISNIHLKDRIFNGNTVPLANGSVNFDLFFSILSKTNYSGDLIIQGARENELKIAPYETCKKYHNFVKDYIDKLF